MKTTITINSKLKPYAQKTMLMKLAMMLLSLSRDYKERDKNFVTVRVDGKLLKK